MLTNDLLVPLLAPKNCSIPAVSSNSINYTDCVQWRNAFSGQVCDVACNPGYDTPVGLAPGSCNASVWTNATGTCSEWPKGVVWPGA